MPRPRNRIQLLVFACLITSGVSGPVSAEETRLLVAAAVSLRELALELGREVERAEPDIALTFSFGASRALARQIRLGAPIDLFLSADDSILDALEDAGRVEPSERVRFARNRLVVMRSPRVDLEIRSARDLLMPENRRIAIASEAAPLGRYSREWLKARGIEAGLDDRIVMTEHARATLAAVDLGQVDFAIVYASDVASASRVKGRASIALSIPDAEQPAIVYGGALIRPPRTQSARQAGMRVLRRLEEPSTRRLLERHGFGSLRPEG